MKIYREGTIKLFVFNSKLGRIGRMHGSCRADIQSIIELKTRPGFVPSAKVVHGSAPFDILPVDETSCRRNELAPFILILTK